MTDSEVFDPDNEAGVESEAAYEAETETESDFEPVGEIPDEVSTAYDETATLLSSPAELADDAHERYLAGDYAGAIPLLIARRERLTDLRALAITDYNLALSYAHLGHHKECAYWIERYLEQAYGDRDLLAETDVSGPRYAFVLYYAAATGRDLPPPKDL